MQWSLIHFEFILYVLWEHVLNSFFYMELSSFPSTTYQTVSFSLCIFLALLPLIRLNHLAWSRSVHGCLEKATYPARKFISVELLSRAWLFVTPWLQHASPPCPSPTAGVYPNPCPLSQWCHPTISSSVIPFSSCSQSCPASGSFQMSQLFASDGQSIGVSVSTSVLPMNTQDLYPYKPIHFIT